jgi:Retroviral aspartyl protease
MFALIDSGSTRNFVNPSILTDFNSLIEATHPMLVRIVNGDYMASDFKCQALKFSIQGYNFCQDLYLLPLHGYDVILGLDWLAQFGPMSIDWHARWVKFQQQGETMKLQAIPENTALQWCEENNEGKKT